MKIHVFRQRGHMMVPASPAGWLLVLAAVAFAVYMFIRIDKVSHSVSDTLINFVAVLVLIFAVYMIVASLLQLLDRQRSED